MPLLRAAAFFLFALAAQAQVAPSRPGLVVGQVVDGVTGRPLGGAVVALGGSQMPTAQAPRVLVGSDGRFVFRDLRRGDYTITAAKNGYAEGAYGRTRAGGASSSLTVGDGDRLGDVVVRLWKHAAISGTIVDESGERLVGVEVRAYRRTVVAGRRRFTPTGSARTDDRGVYRLGGLIPGDYLVGTVGRHIALPLSALQNAGPGTQERNIAVEVGLATPDDRRFAVLQAGDAGIVFGRGVPTPPPPIDGRLATYPAIFHPNASAGEGAAVITVHPGEEYASADLQLAPITAVRVSGTVMGPDGPMTRVALRLHPQNTVEIFGAADVPSTLTDLAGAFTFPSVPSGEYRIQLVRQARTGPGLAPSLTWLDEPITVGNEDLRSLGLVAQPGLHISGRLEFDGANTRTALAGVAITLESVDTPPGAGAVSFTARTSTNGEFVSPPIPGGRYFIRVPASPSGWMFKGATVDGRDATDTPVTITANVPNVVVTFTDKWSGLRGTVQGAGGRDSTALVVVFPTDRDTWGSSGLNPRRVRSTKPGKTGEYSLTLPPADYYVAAIPDEFSTEWQDPDLIDRISRVATRVTIVEGERRIQDLRTREPR